jgi:glycosyltransferase involved in cell wall biosynthesis
VSKISILIPLYNSAPFLEKLNDSLVNQTYKNLEIIYINDESPDNSLEIVQKFSLNDNRIKIIDKKNEGQASALNDAIIVSEGEFIMFIDADDWIELNTCELAIYKQLEYNTDMVFWCNIKEYSNKSVPYSKFFPDSKLFIGDDLQNLRRRMIGLLGQELRQPMQTDAFNAGWGKLYKSNVLKKNNITWTATQIVGSSDVLFNAKLMPFINSVYYLNIHLHHYNKTNPNSLTKTYKNTLYLKFQNLFNELEKVISKHYNNSVDRQVFDKALQNRIALSTINIGLGLISNGFSKNGFLDLKKIINSDRYRESYKQLEISFLPIHYQLFFYTCKYEFTILAYLILFTMAKFRKS